MRCLNNLDRIIYSKDNILKLLKLYEYKGKDLYYIEVLKSNINYLKKNTYQRNALYFGEFFKNDVSNYRKKMIYIKDSLPKNKEEEQLYNIKEVFYKISENINKFELNTHELLSLVQLISNNHKKVVYRTYQDNNKFHLLNNGKKISCRIELENLIDKYNAIISKKEYEIVDIIVNFYIDFINIKPFTEYNELIGLLLLFILLIKEGFNVLNYFSFFEYIYNNYDYFKKTEAEANYKYEYGYSNTDPMHEFIVKILINCYESIDNLVKNKEIDFQINKSDDIENTIYRLNDVFTKEDIRKAHPYVSDSTIDRTLKRLRDLNIIRPNGTGRSASWIRLKNVERFEDNLEESLSLFDDILNEK